MLKNIICENHLEIDLCWLHLLDEHRFSLQESHLWTESTECIQLFS